jgi:cellobiose phosphorylase
MILVLHDFVELLSFDDSHEPIEAYTLAADSLAEAIETSAWDGAWYRRAYYDNGQPLGSSESEEAVIDSLSQSWAVISKAGDPERSREALQSAYQKLVKIKDKIVLLLTPPFDKTVEDPGYIKGYPPGVRENGGQYTHGSLWLPMAYAIVGEGGKAVELLKMMHPYQHTGNRGEVDRYRIEPFVTAGDVYDLSGQEGRGGWSWYTGSAAWMYRIWLEEILGFKLLGDRFYIDCCIPKEWDQYRIKYRYKNTIYDISVQNPQHLEKGNTKVTLDGTLLEDGIVHLVDDGKTHEVKMLLSSRA